MNDEHGKGEDNQHKFTIIVNAREKEVHDKKQGFDDIVRLAFDAPPSGPNVVFTITYRNGPPNDKEGTLIEGKTVHIQDGMVFNVTATDKS